MQDMINSTKGILNTKISYIHLFLTLVISIVLLIFLMYLNIFLYYIAFGDAGTYSPKYHLLHIILTYNLIAISIIICINSLLMIRNYKLQKLSYVKSYVIVIIAMITLYFLRDILLSNIIYS